MLRSRSQYIKFYCHNLGGFDIIFILSLLLRYNEHHDDKYHLNYILRDKSIIRITLSKKINNITRKFSIQDSYCILSESQLSLSKKFKVDAL